jgi:hypothetical protein
MGLVSIGFLLSLGASAWLVAQVSVLSASDFILTALFMFIGVSIPILYGAYLWVKPSPQETSETESDVEQALHLLDVLSPNTPTKFTQITALTPISSIQIVERLGELIRLRIFNGYINWRDEWVCVVPADELRMVKNCYVCHHLLNLNFVQQSVCSCAKCGTDYIIASEA